MNTLNIKRGHMERLTIENYKQLEPYIKDADYNEYNSNIVTMLMWQGSYPVYFSCYEHFALVYNKMPHREPVWLMPYCKKEYRKEAVDKIKELSEQEHISFEIHSMIKEFKDWLQETYPNEFLIWDCYNARDYIYDRKQQETLAGKKMQKRRNHFHSFEKEYEGRYHYKTLDKEDIPHIYEFLAYWKKQKEAMDSIDVEEEGIHFLLEHMEELPIMGGCIYIDGKLEAFNITSLVSHDTIQIHVEKANKQIRGLYIAILKLFLETLDDAVLYVNREDDMGLPELRKAKTDMQPISKTRKFGSCYQKIIIRKAVPEDISAIKNLWLSNFEDETPASTDYYFEHFYHMEDCYVCVSEDEFISMLQLRPLSLMLNGKKEDVSFVVGVATNKEYEGCAYMKQLLQYAMAQASKTQNYMILQAYNWDIYRSFGFEECYKFAKIKLSKDAYSQGEGAFVSTYDIKTLLSLYEIYVQDKNGYRIRDLAYYENLFLPNAHLWHQDIQVFEVQGKAVGYIVKEEHADETDILEFIYEDTNALNNMLYALSQSDKKIIIHTDLQTEITGRKKEATYMMMVSLHGASLPDSNLYINETL